MFRHPFDGSVRRMHSLDAQCLLAHLAAADGGVAFPDRWRHGRDGSLTYGFGTSPNTFTWRAAQVADMAARWRALGVKRPASVAAFAAAHHRLLESLRRAGRADPDVICHELTAREVFAVWEDERVIVTVDGVGDPVVDVAVSN